MIVRNLQRDHLFSDKIAYSGIGIRNRIHLLAADSAWIMKGQEDHFSFGLGPGQGGGELRFPINFFSHGAFSFSANAALDKINKKV
jgi:hypothetical protein